MGNCGKLVVTVKLHAVKLLDRKRSFVTLLNASCFLPTCSATSHVPLSKSPKGMDRVTVPVSDAHDPPMKDPFTKIGMG
jgi:hypothetical protein